MDDYVCRYNITAREKLFIQQDNSWISSAEEFWVNKALSRSPGIDEMGSFLLPQYAAFVIAQVLIYFILIKGLHFLPTLYPQLKMNFTKFSQMGSANVEFFSL